MKVGSVIMVGWTGLISDLTLIVLGEGRGGGKIGHATQNSVKMTLYIRYNRWDPVKNKYK